MAAIREDLSESSCFFGKVTLAFSQCQHILYVLCLKMFRQKLLSSLGCEKRDAGGKVTRRGTVTKETLNRDGDKFIPEEDVVKMDSL